MARIRTFIAVDVSQAVRKRAAVLQEKLQTCEVNTTWTASENIHITLQFLGDVDETLVPEVCKRVATATAPFAPFHAVFSQVGAFPAPDRPRTVWIGVDQGNQELVDLQFAVQESLAEMRFPRERRTYKPHLTIGRVREGGPRQRRLAELLSHFRDFKAESCDVTEAVIMASYLERSGPTYHIMGRAPLEGE